MAHAALLAVRDGRGELCEEAARALGRQRAALRHNLIVEAVGDKFHDCVIHLGLRARARAVRVQPDDVLVREALHDEALGAGPLDEARVRAVDHLDG